MKQAIIAFVPVIHKGYVDFFSTHEGDIFIFSQQLINEYVHLTRDLRVIDPDQAVMALQSIFPGRKVTTISKGSGVESYSKIVMPDDEVCRDFADKHIQGKDITYVSVFLRWNRIITSKEHEIPPHRKITQEQFHKEMMQLATKETAKSSDWWRQIASVFVKDGKVVITTYNNHLPTDFHLSVNGDPRSNFDAGQHTDIYTSIHSEAKGVSLAAKEGISVEGASVYVTTFPCPNCARMLAMAGIKKVFYSKGYSLLDAEKILEHFGIEIVMVKD